MKEIEKCENDEVGRKYIFDDGTYYYSVTTMLGATKNMKTLNEWRKRIGNKKADAICEIAKKSGTDMHEALEYYLNNKSYIYPNTFIKNLAKQIIPYLKQKVKHVYSTERPVWSDKLKLAGTADAFVDYLIRNEAIYSVLDFKTSKRVPKIEWIQDYFIQLYIYSQMIAEMTNSTPPQYGILLFAFKEQRSRKNQIIVKLPTYEYKAMKRIELFHKTIEKP